MTIMKTSVSVDSYISNDKSRYKFEFKKRVEDDDALFTVDGVDNVPSISELTIKFSYPSNIDIRSVDDYLSNQDDIILDISCTNLKWMKPKKAKKYRYVPVYSKIYDLKRRFTKSEMFLITHANMYVIFTNDLPISYYKELISNLSEVLDIKNALNGAMDKQ